MYARNLWNLLGRGMPVSDRAIEMSAPQLARKKLLGALQPFLDKTKIRPFGHDVLIAVYTRANEKTAGGIIFPDSNREDEFQGITGLILAMGPLASDNNPEFLPWFGGLPPRVGDWIGFNVQDGKMFKVGPITCRLIEWKYLRFATDAPDAVM